MPSLTSRTLVTASLCLCCSVFIGGSDLARAPDHFEKERTNRLLSSLSSDLVPEFSPGFPANVTVQRESSAFLDCPVSNPGDRPVSYPLISWVRIRDWHILTNGLVRFTTDDRFNVLYKEGSFNWVLQIKFVQDRDGGIYECQVSTSTGTISRRVELNVVFPEAYIKGGEEYHVDEGSPISLTCVLDSTPSPPQYIFWYHNDRMVNYHVERGVKVTTYSTASQTTESKLTFSNASKRDEGNYTCSPSNSVPATVQLYVTKRNSFAADPLMRHSATSRGAKVRNVSFSIIFSFILLILTTAMKTL